MMMIMIIHTYGTATSYSLSLTGEVNANELMLVFPPARFFYCHCCITEREFTLTDSQVAEE